MFDGEQKLVGQLRALDAIADEFGIGHGDEKPENEWVPFLGEQLGFHTSPDRILPNFGKIGRMKADDPEFAESIEKAINAKKGRSGGSTLPPTGFSRRTTSPSRSQRSSVPLDTGLKVLVESSPEIRCLDAAYVGRKKNDIANVGRSFQGMLFERNTRDVR